MRNSKETGLIFFLVIFLFFALSGITLAKELEITYPTVPGAQTTTDVKTLLPEYVRYIFNFSIWIAGLVAFGTLIYGGIKYLTSAGNPASMDDAKDQIFAGILGLIILLSSYLILYNLNPQLVVLKAELPGLGPPAETIGVYLCKDSSKTSCIVYGDTSATLSSDIDDQVGYIYFQNSASATFGAVLHENKNQQGSCRVYLTDGPVHLPSGEPSSITVFRRGTPSGEGVSLYEKKEYKNLIWGPYPEQLYVPFGGEGRSIKIVNNGAYLAAVYEHIDGSGLCEVFTQSDPDLASNYIGQCGALSNLGCFGAITVLPIK